VFAIMVLSITTGRAAARRLLETAAKPLA
jgi:hypothetical protein